MKVIIGVILIALIIIGIKAYQNKKQNALIPGPQPGDSHTTIFSNMDAVANVATMASNSVPDTILVNTGYAYSEGPATQFQPYLTQPIVQ